MANTSSVTQNTWRLLTSNTQNYTEYAVKSEKLQLTLNFKDQEHFSQFMNMHHSGKET